MSKINPLVELIQSMTKTEKRYFNLHALQHRGDSDALRLFNIINTMSEYDEALVRKHPEFKNRLKKFHDTKNYLYKLLLKSLNSYSANAGADNQLTELLQSIKLLFNKGLYRQSQKLLVKAKHLAEQYEKYELLLEFLKLERNIAVVYRQSDSFEKRINAIYNERRAAAKKLENEDEYARLADKVRSLTISEGKKVRGGQALQAFNKIMRHTLLQNETKAITRGAKRNFYFTHAVFYQKTGDHEKSYHYCKKMVGLSESFPEEIQAQPYVYFFNLANLIIASNTIGKEQEWLAALKKMRTIPQLLGKKCPEDMKVKIFERSYNHELDRYLDTCQFEKAVSLIPDIEKRFEEFKGKISKESEIVFCSNCAYIYFIQQQYHSALTWNNKIINDAEAGIRQDIYGNARILNLLIHYELGNEDMLEHTVKSTYRYLYKKNRLYKTETAILNFIRTKVPKIFTDKEWIAAFKELKTELEEITKDDFEKNVLKDIDYISWLESKIEGRSFAEALRGKSRQAGKKK